MTKEKMKIGVNGTLLYGSNQATYLLKDMDDSSRVNSLSSFLWENFSEAKYCASGLAAFLKKGFYSEFFEWYSRKKGEDEEIGSEDQLASMLSGSKDIFLRSEFFDTKNLLSIGKFQKYEYTFSDMSTIARIKKSEIDNTSKLIIGGYGYGMSFNPSFLYQAGEKFGELVEHDFRELIKYD